MSKTVEKNQTDKQVHAVESKKPAKKGKIHKTLIYLILLGLILFFTNPNLYFFLSEDQKTSVASVLNDLIGDFTQIGKVVNINVITILQLVVMILFVLLIHSLAQMVLSVVKWKNGRGQTIGTLFSSIMKYAALLAGFFWGLAIIGVNISTIFASVGIMALIISFGAESLIADVITGLFMIFENQYQVGDIVEVDGFRGTVTAITIRTTCVTDVGDNKKIFNNSDMRNIINLSDRLSTAVSDIGIPYEADLRKVRKIMEEILVEVQKEYPEMFETVPQYLGVQELAESCVVLRVIAKVKEEDRFNAARALNEELKIRLEEKNIIVPFPQIVVHKES